jgi:hypothetical protein
LQTRLGLASRAVRTSPYGAVPGRSGDRTASALQEEAYKGKESVGDTTDGTPVRVAALSQGSVVRATLGIELGGDTRPMIDGVAQSDVRSVAHDDKLGFAAAFGDRRTPDNVRNA